jgi:hypothetical protein
MDTRYIWLDQNIQKPCYTVTPTETERRAREAKKMGFTMMICVGSREWYRVGGADFWIFWIFNRRQPAADVKCYSKTKVEKAFFFISCLPLWKFLIFWTPYRPIIKKKFGPIKWFFELKISFPKKEDM